MLDWRTLRDDVADLVLARACAGCDTAGTVLCDSCWSWLTRETMEQTLPDGASARASAAYSGIGRNVILAHKERGWNALTPMLGILLARAITAITDQPVALVPIPPHAQSIARRGTDPLADIVNAAARSLRSIGQPASCTALLARARDHGALKELDRRSRARAVQSAFAVNPRTRAPSGTVVVVDDVITTGITLVEARQALASGGIHVAGAAAVASTPLHGGRH
ncbi:MAG: ComF family protein [Candidatus Nanopelagicales bacterium]